MAAKPNTLVSSDLPVPSISNEEEDELLSDVAMNVTIQSQSATASNSGNNISSGDNNILPVILNLQDTMNILSQNIDKMGNAFLNTNNISLPGSSNSATIIKPSRKRKHDVDIQSTPISKKPMHHISSSDISDESDTDISDSEVLTRPVNNSPDILSQLETEFSGEEPTSNPISERLANIVNKRFMTKLTDDKMREKIDKYARPSNCDQLTVPIVNLEIWGKLSKITKTQDLRMAGIQRSIIKASVAICNSVDVLLKNNTAPEIVTQLVDSIALLGNASQDISYKRRDLVKPSLNKEFSSLCSKNVPITGNQLFGEELQKSLLSIKETNRLSKQVQHKKPEPQRSS